MIVACIVYLLKQCVYMIKKFVSIKSMFYIELVDFVGKRCIKV